MIVRHWTGQRKLISILNQLGHSIADPKVMEVDTAIAARQMVRGQTPKGFKKHVFTQLAWDNNDFGEETLSGKGTTHNTNGIIVQIGSSQKVKLMETLAPSPKLVGAASSSLKSLFLTTTHGRKLDLQQIHVTT